MTDAELKELLRPHVARMTQAFRPPAPAPATFSESHEPADGTARPATFYAAAGFSADDAGAVGRYFAADDDGHYPGDVHRYFGLNVRDFADRSHLVRKQIETTTGRRWYWVNPEKGKHAGKEDTPAAPKPEAPAKPDPKAVHAEVAAAFAAPHTLTPEKVADLTAKLKTLSVEQLKALQADRAKGGKVKQDRVNKLVEWAKAQTTPKPPEKPAPGVGDPGGFAAAVHDTAAGLPSASGRPSDPGSPVPHKVLVADLYDAMAPRLGGMSLDAFKQNLSAAARAGRLSLEPIDMPSAVRDRGQLARSTTTRAGADSHAVLVPAGHRPPAPPAAKPAPHAAAELGRHVAALASDLLRDRHHQSGMVPLHELRDEVRKRFGDAAAGQTAFNAAVLDLWRSGHAKLVPISDLSRATKSQLGDSIPGMGETLFFLAPTATPAPPPSSPTPAPKPPPEKPAPHAAARAALDAHGIAHGHLTDAEVSDRLRAAFAPPKKPTPAPKPTPKPPAKKPTPAPKPTPKPPAKKPAPAKPPAKPAPAPKAPPAKKPAGGHLDTTEKELNDTAALDRSDPAGSPARADAAVARLKATHTADEIKELARRLTGKAGRTPDEALARIHGELTPVSRLLDSQKV